MFFSILNYLCTSTPSIGSWVKIERNNVSLGFTVLCQMPLRYNWIFIVKCLFLNMWKIKCKLTCISCFRGSNNERNESPGTDDGSVSPEPPDRPPGKVRQIHPEDKAQFLAYDSTYRKKPKPKSLPLEDNQMYSHLANTNVAMSPMYPLTPNICVEGGKIEFIKSPPGSARSSVALVSPPQTPVVVRRASREKVRCSDEQVEKFDGDKVDGAVFKFFHYHYFLIK